MTACNADINLLFSFGTRNYQLVRVPLGRMSSCTRVALITCRTALFTPTVNHTKLENCVCGPLLAVETLDLGYKLNRAAMLSNIAQRL